MSIWNEYFIELCVSCYGLYPLLGRREWSVDSESKKNFDTGRYRFIFQLVNNSKYLESRTIDFGKMFISAIQLKQLFVINKLKQ